MLLTCPTYSPQVAMAFEWMFQTPVPYSFSPFSSGALLGFEIAVSCGCIMYMVLRSRCECKLCMQQTPHGVRIDIVPWRPLHLLARSQLVCLLACKSNWVPVPSMPHGLPFMLPMRIVAQYQRVPPHPPPLHAPFIHPSPPLKQPMEFVCQSVLKPSPPFHMPFIHPCLPLKLPTEPVCQSCFKSPPYRVCFALPCLPFKPPQEPVHLCHSVNVEVAYTESLEIRSGTGPITMGFLDTMRGSATLSSKGKGITVDGLDGTAHLESHGGPIQVPAKQTYSPYNYEHLFMALPWLVCALILGVRSEMTAI